uniref:Putative 18.7 kDa secreted protein n=1 Tax=Ixodes scapularis TaxID=6945 RepID=Q8MV99_IXOSC|nr:putative 18.7 kDa secreted protein [Ixodes scapularis]
MLAAQLLIVIVACLAGQITCAELDPALKRCEDKVFEDPGYSLGCTYTCENGNTSDDTVYWGIYKDATVCVDLQDGDPNQFNHIGTCKSGTCVEYKEENIQQVWSTLPETQAQFHHCLRMSSKDPVDSCLYICKKHHHGKERYFYGAYEDSNKCNLKNGDIGVCLSAFCHGPEYFPPIDNGPLKPSK